MPEITLQQGKPVKLHLILLWTPREDILLEQPYHGAFLFAGVQGHDISIDNKGESEANYTVLGLKADATAKFGKALRTIGNFLIKNDCEIVSK